MNAADQFHVGIVVDDLDSALLQLSDLFGYEWCDKFGGPIPVLVPGGETTVDFSFAYSRTPPRLEVIQRVPGTLWVPVAGSGIHHLGYWSDDVAADAARLAVRGWAAEATGLRPDGTPYWAFHRSPDGPRVELVSRALQPALEQYWTTGSMP